jgi:PAS domain S-box-containing protein
MPAPAFRYLIGVAAIGISVLLRLALAPILGDKFVYILHFPAVMFSAWYGGLGPGLLATALAALHSATYLLPPALTVQVTGAADVLSLVIFILIGIFISALNESARREKAAAQLAGQQLRVTLGSIGDAVVATDREGRVTFMNAVASSLTGWSLRDARGRPVAEVIRLINEETREPVETPIARALRERHTVGLPAQTLLVARDGTERPIDDSSAPMLTSGGELTGAVLVFQDISERREKELDLQFALSAGRMGTWANDPVSGSVTVSPQLARLHGVPPEEYAVAASEYYDRYVHPDDRERVRRAVADALATGSRYEVEYRIVWPDGSVHWLLGKGRTRTDGCGRAIAFAGIAVDVTAIKQTQSREQFLAEASRVLGSSLDYRETLTKVTHLAVPEVADWCTVDMLSEDNTIERLAVTHRDPHKAALAYESARRWPVTLSSPHGLAQVIRTGEAGFAPQLTDEMLAQSTRDPGQLEMLRGLGLKSGIVVPLAARGRMLGAISLVMAESGRTYTESDLLLAQELARRASIAIDNARLFAQAEAANQAKDDFLARLSHELRTPLNAILGWTLMLRTMDARDRLTRGLDVIDRNGRALTRIIEDLLDFSRDVRGGGLRVERVPVDMQPIVAEAIDTVDVMARQKKLHLEWHPNSSCLVMGDRARLQQVVWNLLTNAIKFTPEGGSVRVSLATLPEAAELRVADSGIGIRPEILETIFDPFQQGERHGTPGLGLGLAIVRQVVEAHEGTVLAESAGENRGATLIVRLPRLPG